MGISSWRHTWTMLFFMFPYAHPKSVTPKSEKTASSWKNSWVMCMSWSHYIPEPNIPLKTIFLPLYYTDEAPKKAIFCLNRGFSRSQKVQKLLILTLIYLIGKWSAQKHCLNRGFCLFWRCLNRGSTVPYKNRLFANIWSLKNHFPTISDTCS